MITSQLVIFSFFLVFTEGQVNFPGPCPDYPVVTDFDPPQYLGKWYENQKFPTIFELAGKCITATYTPNEDGSVAVHNSLINGVSNETETIDGYATLADPSVAKLEVVFPSMNTKAPYWVLGTDYTSYSFVWSCTETATGESNYQIAWVLTRERFPSQATLDEAMAIAATLNLNTTYLQLTDQISCPEDHLFY